MSASGVGGANGRHARLRGPARLFGAAMLVTVPALLAGAACLGGADACAAPLQALIAATAITSTAAALVAVPWAILALCRPTATDGPTPRDLRADGGERKVSP